MRHFAQQRTDDGRPPTDPGPPTGRSYADDRRILFKALAALAAGGYPAPPDEGMDLIHDFYVDAWPAIAARYDASRASFETYLFACFVRFARPRIARLGRLRASLVAPSELETMAQDRGQMFPDGAIDAADIAVMRAALSALPSRGRDLLEAYLDDAEPSERALAARFGITRYAVRVTLTDMLGLVATRLGATDGLGDPDRRIATALWAEHRSPRDVATLLGLSTETVQAARLRIFMRLVAAVKGSKTMSTTLHFQSTLQSNSPAALVAAALAPTATARDLDAVGMHAEAICRHLDALAGEAATRTIVAADPHRLAAFYGALSGTMGGTVAGGPSVAALSPLLRARDTDARAVGEALDILLAGIPPAWPLFRDAFAGVATVEPGHLEHLLAGPSLQEVGVGPREMARYGITPIVVAEATRSLSNTAMSFCRQHAIGRQGRLQLDSGRPNERDDRLPLLERWTAEQELRLDMELGPDATGAFYDWLHAIAGHLPLVFDGFETALSGRTLVLTRTDTAEPDLFKRWNADWNGIATR